MAFNGAGVFVRLYNWVNDAANAINITASRMDAETDGIAAGLSNCITRDGQGKPSTAIDWNAQNLTNVAAFSATGNATIGGSATVAGSLTASSNLTVKGADNTPSLNLINRPGAVGGAAFGFDFIAAQGGTDTGDLVMYATPNTGGAVLTEYARLSAAGKFGVANVTPQALVSVGSITPGTSEATNKGVIQIGSAGGASATGGAGLEFKTSAAGAGYGWSIASPDLGSSVVPLIVSYRASSATWTEAMRFNNNGTAMFSFAVVGTSFNGFLATGNVSQFTNDAGYITSAGAAAAGSLTGTTLAANVTASSLISFGASIALGTPASGNLANCTFPTLNQNTTGTSASTTGNAATATALQTARTINGTSFNGTANVTVTADASTLTNSTLAASVTASSLTSVAAACTVGGISIGYRGLPSASVTTGAFVAADAGKCVFATAGVTVPNSTMSAGDVVVIQDTSGSAQTITATVTTLRQTGTANTGNRTLKAYGRAAILFQSGTVAFISGDVT